MRVGSVELAPLADSPIQAAAIKSFTNRSEVSPRLPCLDPLRTCLYFIALSAMIAQAALGRYYQPKAVQTTTGNRIQGYAGSIATRFVYQNREKTHVELGWKYTVESIAYSE